VNKDVEPPIRTLQLGLGADREVSCRPTRNRGLSVYPRSRLNKDLLKRIKRHKRSNGVHGTVLGEGQGELASCPRRAFLVLVV